MAAYEIDTLVRLSGSFTAVSGNTAADPTNVKLYVMDPGNQVTIYQYSLTEIVKDSVGNYHKDILANQVGNWKYKWQGTGAAQVTSPDATFSVNATVFTVT
jgi:hypothetical protein